MKVVALACSCPPAHDVREAHLSAVEVRTQTVGDMVCCCACTGEGIDSGSQIHAKVVEDSSHLY